jgi:hypothetical protein
MRAGTRCKRVGGGGILLVGGPSGSGSGSLGSGSGSLGSCLSVLALQALLSELLVGCCIGFFVAPLLIPK